jgi:phenylacetate-CoA ligase
MNWRKPLIYLLLHVSGNRIPKILKEIERWEYAGKEQLQIMTNNKLKDILWHAYRNVPYYSDLLKKVGVISGEEIRIENFHKVPLLTKEIIQSQRENLYSKDYQRRKPFENTSGGSTGAPARFIQDREYDQWNIATKIYFNSVLGKRLGEPELKFWGSDRDILKGNLAFKDRIINFIYNRRFFNSYRLGEKEIYELIELNNRFKPRVYWSYMESALELADFLKGHEVDFYPPGSVISTIGPLTEEVRCRIEEGMKSKVYNQYGSREVGAISCECKYQQGLHTFPWWNYVELLDEQLNPVREGQGNVVVTTLHNYSMPLIRYEIGDVAISGGCRCTCGRSTFKLKKVIGRTLGYFRKSDGSLVHSHFIVQSLFFKEWIKRFQVIQESVNDICIKVQVTENIRPFESDTDDIAKKIKVLLGDSCRVRFDYVDEIERSPSGKYIYTICKVK